MVDPLNAEMTRLVLFGGAIAFWVSMALSVGLWVTHDAQARGSSQPTT